MEKKDSCGTQIIYENCEFNSKGLDTFVNRVNLPECRTDYVVVSIIGPQSGGKSTLMNHLFDTKFQEMNPDRRGQTTKGIWIAKCVGVEPCTVALDLEGTDGSERGEDGSAFEKKCALFALAISDIVIINMWHHEIGRENAANRPLLRTVFKEMLRLKDTPGRQKALLFVIRDKTTQSPFENAALQVKEDIQKIWDAVRKPQAHKFSELFRVHVVGLSHYEHLREKFEEEVAQLRRCFDNSTSPGGIASDRRGVVPASAFSDMTRQIWEDIKQNKDLDLPSPRFMAATVRCKAIAYEKLKHFEKSEDWLSLKKDAETRPVPVFGKRVSSILDSHLSEYDKEVMDFDERARKSERDSLQSTILKSAEVAYGTTLVHLWTKEFEGFKDRVKSLDPEKGFVASLRACIDSSMSIFRQGCADAAVQHSNWSFSSVEQKLKGDINAHASRVKSKKLSELKDKCEEQLVASLTSKVDPEFGNGREDMWVSIRSILKLETEKAIPTLSTIKDSFELNEKEFNAMKQDLSNIAREEVKKRARDNIVADKVLIQMKRRFASVFCYDNNSQPRVWKGHNDINAAKKDAHSASLKILDVMAIIDLDEKSNNVEELTVDLDEIIVLDEKSNNVEELTVDLDEIIVLDEKSNNVEELTVDLDEKSNYVKETLSSCKKDKTENTLPSSSQKVLPEDILFTPIQYQQLLKQFKEETLIHIEKATSAVRDHMELKLKIAELVINAFLTVAGAGSAVADILQRFSS